MHLIPLLKLINLTLFKALFVPCVIKKIMQSREEEALAEARKTLYQHGYENMRPIGGGGFASVYQITSRQYQEDFVVKLIDIRPDISVEASIDDSSSPGNSQEPLPSSFKAEITALINLYHPHVIKIFNHFNSQSLLYIILEFCPGGSLKDVISKIGFIKAPFIYELCVQIIQALRFCHSQGIAHRDVKPSNILIDKYGRAKLADFGLAQHFNNNSALINTFNGSIPFLAPEILLMQPYDPMKADVWALGVTFYEMASGKLPFDSSSPEKILSMIQSNSLYTPPHFEPQFTAAIKLMLNPNPNRRCSLNDLLRFPIFRKAAAGLHDRSSLSNTLSPVKTHMKPIASTLLTVKSAHSRRTPLYSKRRAVIPLETPSNEYFTTNF